ncbi:hypothetical protein [Bacillus infantis]|uniref:hypothetical protein n=1 Tax=Bacillus infantis TaxID=324767 RepID=UPI003CF263E9
MKLEYQDIENIVYNILNKEKLLNKQWHLGTIDTVISPLKVKVFVDGSDVSQTVSCNPDITFTSGDYVWVLYINGNPRDKFVISKRAI